VPGDRAGQSRAARRTSILQPVLKWAVAASVLFGAGFALARFTQPKPPDLDALRVELKRDLRADLSQQFAVERARLRADQLARNSAVERGLDEALADLEARQTVVNAALRRDIVTLAVNAQQRFDEVAVAEPTVREKELAPQE
jgi:hypothetical protein